VNPKSGIGVILIAHQNLRMSGLSTKSCFTEGEERHLELRNDEVDFLLPCK